MRKLICLIAVVLMVFVGTTPAQADPGENRGKNECASVQDGTLVTSDGYAIGAGWDQWGYNYGGHQFRGVYCDAYHQADWCQEYNEVLLVMKWNDSWLSSRDCDDDGELDRHFGWPGWRNSGAWITNQMWGQDENGDSWVYSVKIVAVPRAAFIWFDGMWYDHDGKLIGPPIWGDFAVILETEMGDAVKGRNVLFKSESSSGLGSHKNRPQ